MKSINVDWISFPSFVFARKLKATKEDLKQWNKQEFGDVPFKKKRLVG